METIAPTFASWTSLLFAMALTASCGEPTPQEQDPAVQGNFYDGDAEHRPGQPCLLCHGPGHLFNFPPGHRKWEMAGTVYPDLESPADAGLEGVRVEITDAAERVFVAETNRVGNFMIQHDAALTEPKLVQPGWVAVPDKPVYPLTVAISRGQDENQMHTKIWGNGGCGHCHRATLSENSVGRVILFGQEDDDDGDYKGQTGNANQATSTWTQENAQ